jgi:hypothetical protein
MPPTCPASLDTMKTSKLDNEGDVRVIVIIRASGHIHNNISHTNVFSIGSKTQTIDKKRIDPENQIMSELLT